MEKNPNYHLILTCPDEFKKEVAEEARRMDVEILEAELYRAVRVLAKNDKEFYRLHLSLSQPSRILWEIAKGSFFTLENLTRVISKFHWEDYFDTRHSLSLETYFYEKKAERSYSKKITHAILDGIRERWKKNEWGVPNFQMKESKVSIIFFFTDKHFTVSLDTAGKSLHKRGFRVGSHPAPLKETMAASLLEFMGYHGETNFYDPMCGGGTILIEACFRALHKSPLIHRQKGDWGFEWLKMFKNAIWRTAQDECRTQRNTSSAVKVFGSDIEKDYIAISKKNALKARIEKDIQFFTGDFFEVRAPASEGTLLTNLPYGERIGKETLGEDSIPYFKQLGDHLKKNYQGWKVGILVAEALPWKHVGLKPTKKLSCYNGSIPCKFLIFDIYSGTKRKKE